MKEPFDFIEAPIGMHFGRIFRIGFILAAEFLLPANVVAIKKKNGMDIALRITENS